MVVVRALLCVLFFLPPECLWNKVSIVYLELIIVVSPCAAVLCSAEGVLGLGQVFNDLVHAVCVAADVMPFFLFIFSLLTGHSWLRAQNSGNSSCLMDSGQSFRRRATRWVRLD